MRMLRGIFAGVLMPGIVSLAGVVSVNPGVSVVVDVFVGHANDAPASGASECLDIVLVGQRFSQTRILKRNKRA